MRAKKHSKSRTCDPCKRIKEWQKDPEFIRAAYEFVLYHTSPR